MIYGGVKLCTYLLPLNSRRREMVVSVALVTQLRELFLLFFCLFRTEYWNKCVGCRLWLLITYPRNVDPARWASVSGDTMLVDPLLEQ